MKCIELHADWNPKSEYELTERERTEKLALTGTSVWQNPEIRVTESQRPDPDSNEVLVRVQFAGICGSDLQMTETGADGYTRYSAYSSFPNIIGHEFSGTVADIGSNVTQFEKGDIVTSEVTDYCGVCEMCRSSRPAQCTSFDEIGFTTPGAFAEYVTLPEKLLWDVSPLRNFYETDEETMMAAATVEPSTITYNALYVRTNEIKPGAYYVFHGGGPIGLTGINVAKGCGASKVILLEPVKERREIARKLGFSHAYDPTKESIRSKIMEITDGKGVDVHAETAGVPEKTYPLISDTLAAEGAVVQIGISDQSPNQDLRYLQSKHGQILGSQGHTGHGVYPRVIRAMAAGKIDNLGLVTDIYELSEIEAALEDARTRRGGKILVEVGGGNNE